MVDDNGSLKDSLSKVSKRHLWALVKCQAMCFYYTEKAGHLFIILLLILLLFLLKILKSATIDLLQINIFKSSIFPKNPSKYPHL